MNNYVAKVCNPWYYAKHSTIFNINLTIEFKVNRRMGVKYDGSISSVWAICSRQEVGENYFMLLFFEAAGVAFF